MTSLYDGREFYKRMLDLQEKLRKSEEERIRLEERFNFLEHESRSRHEACINKLRMRYIEFLEEQRFRDERNNKLLNTLDRVDTNLVLMNAKTDRLYILRKEYEASILRAFTSRRHPPSITGDSGIVSQNDERLIRREIQNPRYNCGRSILSSPIPPSIPGSVYSFSTFPTVNFDFEQRATPSYLVPRTSDRSPPFIRSRFLDPVDNLRENYASHFIGNMKSRTWDRTHQEPRYRDRGDYPTTYNYRSSNLDNNFVRRNYTASARDTSSFRYPETLATPKNSKLSAILANTKEERVGKILENELERYISKIRNLHGEIIPQSLEEIDHEQNTSGDLLNVTLSDDGLDHLPVEDKKQQHISKEVENILALADDLASRTVENRKIKSDIFPDMRQNSKDPVGHQNDLQERENSSKARSVPFNRNWLKVQQQLPTKIQIGGGVAKDVTKINQSQRNIEAITKSRSIAEPKDQIDDFNDHSLGAITSQSGERFNNQEHPEIPQQLENWNTGNSEHSKNEIAGVAVNFAEGNLQEASRVENERDLGGAAVDTEPEAINPQMYEANGGNKNVGYESTGDSYQEGQIDQSYSQDPQAYQDPNQEYTYNNQEYQQDPQYQYDPNVNYEQDPNVNYEQDPNVNYEQSPNANYEQDPNAEYQYDQQYSQYPADPNAQYPDGQYAEDPTQYQYTEDPTQQYPAEYSQDPNQQYDPNYAYNYDETQPYQEHGNYEAYEGSTVVEGQAVIETADDQNQSTHDPVKKDDSLSNPIETKKSSKDVIKSILESDTDSTIEKNVSNTESDFDFN